MNVETLLPYHWIATYPKELASLDSVPLLGAPPSFNFAAFSSSLQKSLGLQSLKTVPGDLSWKTKEAILEGMGENPNILTLSVAPLKGHAYWIFPEAALKKLFTLTVGTEEALFPEQEREWEKEFYHFAAFEALQAFAKSEFDPSLLPQILDSDTLPEAPCLCLDIALETDGQKLSGRFALSKELQEAFQNKFHSTSLNYSEGLLESALITLQAVGASTSLTLPEWESLQPGDFLLLDRCTFSLEENKSRLALWFDGKPLFRAQPKENQLKILEYPLLHEVTSPMAKKDEFEEEDEEFETFDESTQEEDLTEDEELTEEEHDEAEEELTHEEEEEELTQEEEEGEEEELKASEEVRQAVHEQKGTAPQSGQPSPKEKLIKPEAIPMTVAIETGRIRMTLKQLMELAPGNVIDLDIRPERGVDLTVNGKCIGRGELLKIGENLGVRILEKA